MGKELNKYFDSLLKCTDMLLKKTLNPERSPPSILNVHQCPAFRQTRKPEAPAAGGTRFSPGRTKY
jgi:hypothetical protein